MAGWQMEWTLLQRVMLFSFEFRGVEKNLIPNLWHMVLAIVLFQNVIILKYWQLYSSIQ